VAGDSCPSPITPLPLSALRASGCGLSGLAEIVHCIYMYVCTSSVQSLKSEFFSFLPSFMAGRLDWTTLTAEKILVRICLYCLKCRKYDQLILRRIIKIIATRCQILKLKCTKFNFGWGSAPDPAGGAYSAPQTP